MLKNLRMFSAIGVFAVLMLCVSVSFAQRPIVGGYKAAPVDADDVIAAADFAAAEQNKKEDRNLRVVEVKSAEKQVVQGTNYRLCLEIQTGGDEGEKFFAKTVVYYDLKKNYKLTSWVEGDCAPKAAASSTRPPIVGGYSKAATEADDVIAAADFAAAEQNKKDDNNLRVIAVKTAEKQVVAGMNYRLCVEVMTGGDEGEKYLAKTVVYQNLQQAYSLTSWAKAATCGK